MSQVKDIDGLRFSFPDDWRVLKYDDSSFHRNQFQSFAGGSKAVDAVAVSPNGDCWLIEVKDYRRSRRSKPGSVFAEIGAKVRATLAGLSTARVRANDPDEKSFASYVMQGSSLRVVLHLDQPTHNSRLFPQVVDPKTALTQLRREVRAVDPHALCCGLGVAIASLPWTVSTRSS